MAESTSPSRAPQASPEALPEREILEAIAGIRYGSVEITIHEGRVVQIECREKIRLGGDGTSRSPVRQIR